MRARIVAATVAVMGFLAAAPLGSGIVGTASAETKWDMPTAYPVSNFHTVNIQKFADSVAKDSGGKLKIVVHAGASLFKAPEIKRAVQTGQAQIGEVLMVNLSNEDPIFGIDGIPFLASNYAEAKKLADAARPYVEKRLAAQGLKLLFTVPWPPQGIYSNTPLKSVADMAGLKWRAYSPQTARIGELVKAQPVTVQQSELSQALATGKVNATMTSGATGVDTKMWEQLKYFYDTQAWLPKNMVVVNKAAFDKLDKATQKVVMDDAAKAQAAGWAESQTVTKKTLAELKAHGMVVEAPAPAFKKELSGIGKVMAEEWQKKAGPDGAAILSAYRK